MKGSLRIELPNLVLIPMISVVCGIIKAFGGVEWNWINVLVTFPISAYFLWCIGYFFVVFMSIWIYGTIKGR